MQRRRPLGYRRPSCVRATSPVEYDRIRLGTSKVQGWQVVPSGALHRVVPAARLRPVAGQDYRGRLRLHGSRESWPTPAVGPDGLPWFGEHRVYPATTDFEEPR